MWGISAGDGGALKGVLRNIQGDMHEENCHTGRRLEQVH